MLASLKRHWIRRTGQSTGEGHEQGMFQNFLEKSGPILLSPRVTNWNPNSLRNRARWRLGPVTLGNEGRGQGTPRQRDLEPSETTHRQGRHIGPMGLQSEIGTQWSSHKFKLRYVAKDFKQVEGLDYYETFAPTCKPETFRILFQQSAKQCDVMHQFDVKTVFLHQQ